MDLYRMPKENYKRYNEPIPTKNVYKMPKWDVWYLMDIVQGIMALEAGEMDEQQTIDFVAEHAETLWQLQGSYQRMIISMKEEGLI